MTTPVLPRSPARRRLDLARVRTWLAAAVVALMVLTYLSVEHTYATSHLPPSRYLPVAPGGVAHGTYADFRLLSLRQTPAWGMDYDAPGTADPGAVWVVANLEVTPRRHQDYLLCTLALVSTDGRKWDPADFPAPHDGEACVPDPEHYEIGTTYPFVLGFQIPEGEADHVAGLGVDLFSWRSYPLLRPPA